MISVITIFLGEQQFLYITLDVQHATVKMAILSYTTILGAAIFGFYYQSTLMLSLFEFLESGNVLVEVHLQLKSLCILRLPDVQRED